MVKMVKVQKQPLSFYGRFKILAQHGFRLVGRVATITMLGRSASSRWSCVRTMELGKQIQLKNLEISMSVNN